MKVWRLRDRSSLRWRQWDARLILFHIPSGDTHLLEQSAGEALLLLVEGPRDTSSLVRELAARLRCEANADLAVSINGLLEELEEFGVVEAGEA